MYCEYQCNKIIIQNHNFYNMSLCGGINRIVISRNETMNGLNTNTSIDNKILSAGAKCNEKANK